MSPTLKTIRFSFLLLFSIFLALPAAAIDPIKEKRFRLELEGGPVWQTKNDVRISGDTGTEFSFKDLTGSGPYAAGRFTADWDFLERHHEKQRSRP